MNRRRMLVALVALGSFACGGGPDARPVRVAFDLLRSGCDEAARCGVHVTGSGVVAKTGDSTSDGFIADKGLPLLHAEVVVSSSPEGTAVLEIVLPNEGSPDVRYHELERGKIVFVGVAERMRGALSPADADWSTDGRFEFDAVNAANNHDVHRIRNGVVEAGAQKQEPAAPQAPSRGGFGTHQIGRTLREQADGEGRSHPQSFGDALVEVVVNIEPLPSGPVEVPVAEPVSDPAPPPAPEVSTGPSDTTAGEPAASSGGGCSGDTASSSDSSGSSCGGSSSDSSGSGSSCDSCGSGSSGASGSSCDGGGGCSGDAAATGGSQKATRAANATARFMWPIGIVAWFNRRARATLKRRLLSPRANREWPGRDDR